MKPAVLMGLLVTVLGLCCAGCSAKKPVAGATAEETAKVFADALNSRDFARAAEAYDYITFARAENENWDDIPSGQRQQIIARLKSQKVDELKMLQKKLGSNIKCGPAQDGVVALTGDAGTVNIGLKATDGVWLITNIW